MRRGSPTSVGFFYSERQMILNQSQAEAVYSAMCALNNVGGRVLAVLDDKLKVREAPRGSVHVLELLAGEWEPCEYYETQGHFAWAYGLNSDEPQSAVAAAAGGLTQTAIER